MTVTPISLSAGCDFAECARFAVPLHRQLSSGSYDECSVLLIPELIEGWQADHRTSRKRARHAERLGYTFARIKRRDYEDDVHAINTSLAHRQGRPMTAGYLTKPSYGADDYTCDLHGVHANGVLDASGRLVAYLWMYRAGELALVSQILGHGDHLKNDVMFLLFRGSLEREIEYGPGVVVYNRHDSGTPGLIQWKEWQGFEERDVEWLP